MMKKAEAIEVLGGTVTRAARSIGLSSQAVSQWKCPLSPVLRDRVLAALARRYMGEAQLIAIARAAMRASKGAAAPRQRALDLDGAH